MHKASSGTLAQTKPVFQTEKKIINMYGQDGGHGK
jgi:hypothetical protein